VADWIEITHNTVRLRVSVNKVRALGFQKDREFLDLLVYDNEIK